MQNKKIAAVVGMLAAVLLASGVASAALTVTPITWNVIGLDSNDPTSGPRRFPVGARVCSNIATTGVNVNFALGTANPYVNVRPGSLTSIVIPALAASACSDAYFEVEVAANPAAYGTTERYSITANDGTGLVSTPVPRELFVERLVSQARNEVSDVKVNGVSIPAGGTMTLMVGSVYDITLVGATATNEEAYLAARIAQEVFKEPRGQRTWTGDTRHQVRSRSALWHVEDAHRHDAHPEGKGHRRHRRRPLGRACFPVMRISFARRLTGEDSSFRGLPLRRLGGALSRRVRESGQAARD